MYNFLLNLYRIQFGLCYIYKTTISHLRLEGRGVAKEGKNWGGPGGGGPLILVHDFLLLF